MAAFGNFRDDERKVWSQAAFGSLQENALKFSFVKISAGGLR